METWCTCRAAFQEGLLQDLPPPHMLIEGSRMQKVEEAIQVIHASAQRRSRHTPSGATAVRSKVARIGDVEQHPLHDICASIWKA